MQLRANAYAARKEIAESRLTRHVLAAAIVLAVVAAVVLDESGGYFADRAVLTNLVTDVALILLTLLVVDEYLRRRAERAWGNVAGLAFEDLAHSARGIWIAIARVGAVPGAPQDLDGYFAYASEREARKALTDRLVALAREPEGRQALLEVLQPAVGRARGIFVRWAPVMAGGDWHATEMNEYATFLRRAAGLVAWLENASLGAVPIGIDETGRLLEWLHRRAIGLDQRSRAAAARR